MTEEPQTPTSPEETPEVQEAQPEKKPSVKKLLLIIIPIVLILAAAATTAVLLFVVPKPTTVSQESTKPITTDDSTGKAMDPAMDMTDYATPIIEEIKTKVPAELKADYPTITQTASDNYAPAWQVDGYDYRYSGNFGKGVSFTLPTNTDSSADFTFTAAVNKIVARILTEHNLQRTSSDPEANNEYQNMNVICSYSNDSSYPASVSCANKHDYTMKVAVTKPFADAYFAVTKVDEKSAMVLGDPKITDSKTAGYKTATVSISGYQGVGGAAGLFYSLGGTWKFFKGTQSELPCSDFNTNDLRIAYEGETCYDTATDTESTVTK